MTKTREIRIRLIAWWSLTALMIVSRMDYRDGTQAILPGLTYTFYILNSCWRTENDFLYVDCISLDL